MAHPSQLYSKLRLTWLPGSPGSPARLESLGATVTVGESKIKRPGPTYFNQTSNICAKWQNDAKTSQGVCIPRCHGRCHGVTVSRCHGDRSHGVTVIGHTVARHVTRTNIVRLPASDRRNGATGGWKGERSSGNGISSR